RIVALGIGVAAHGDCVFAENGRLVGTAGLEAHIGVFSDRGHCVELGEVDRVGRLGAGGDVGQLALRTGAADGHAVFAVRDRAATKRNGANGRRIGAITDRGGVHAVCGAVRADRGSVEAVGLAVGADGRGGVVGRAAVCADRRGADAI